MRLAIIADAFPPMRTSGAVQLRDLSLELVQQGHDTTVMVPAHEQSAAWTLEDWHGIHLLRLGAPRTKDVGYVRRTLSEFLLPWFMLRNLRKSPLAHAAWEGVLWYSPSIFLGPVVKSLKRASGCASYLILRDIFPDWAVDMGLLRRGLAYQVFKRVERYQYAVADAIGVQSAGNLPYLRDWEAAGKRLEVLQNWLADMPDLGARYRIADGPLRGRRVFVYAGNMGIAQGMDVLLDLAEALADHSDIGFLFVGRGSERARLAGRAATRGLGNVDFQDEIEPSEVPGLLAQCEAGLVALDLRHKSHNVPGKFVTYLQAGLPVLACINQGNDLAHLIEREGVGRVCMDGSVATLRRLALELLMSDDERRQVSVRCRTLAAQRYAPAGAVRQIVAALHDHPRFATATAGVDRTSLSAS